jgi:hypothetical protein
MKSVFSLLFKGHTQGIIRSSVCGHIINVIKRFIYVTLRAKPYENKKVTILPYTVFPNFRKGIAVLKVSGIALCLNKSNM